MTFEIELSVTQEHIRKGQKEDACNCPIALALKEALPNWQHVEVDGDIRVTALDEEFSCDADEQMAAFIERFDEGLAVEPFKKWLVFEAEDPEFDDA